MSAFTSVLAALLCWMVIAQAGAEDTSEMVLQFLSLMNGKYESENGLYQVYFKPVKMSCFNDPAYYAVEIFNGECARQELNVVTQDDNSNIIVTIYNITGDNVPPCSGDTNVADVEALSLKNFEQKEPCNGGFRQVRPDVFTGSRQDCRITTEDGQHPVFCFTLACHGFFVESPVAAIEKTTIAPVFSKRVGDRYESRNLPSDYQGVCSKTK